MNIPDLLRAAERLIAHPPPVPVLGGSAKVSSGAAKASDPVETGFLPSFRFLPGHSAASRAASELAERHAGFSDVIALCGPDGTDFSWLVNRWLGVDPLLVTEPELREHPLWADIKAHRASKDGGAVVLLERAVEFSTACLELIHLLSERGQREFTRPIRWVCCYPHPIDQLYDEGRIEDDFYLFLNGRSVNVPALDAIPEDWVDLARAYLAGADPHLTLSVDAIDFLTTEAEFPGGMRELAGCLERARSRLGKRSLIEAIDLQD